jgi:hypothetical protein
MPFRRLPDRQGEPITYNIGGDEMAFAQTYRISCDQQVQVIHSGFKIGEKGL